jgi:hypothetical protein
MKDVHTEHCCRFHGCKYAIHEGCTVADKGALQSFPCEDCDEQQGREIQADRFPRCGALPRDSKDNLPCFLGAGHKAMIHRNLNGHFVRTRPNEGACPTPEPEASVTHSEPPTADPQQRSADRAERQRAMLRLEEAIEKAEGLGRGKAWDALHLIQAVLNRQDANIKRIQREYLTLIDQRLSPIANRETKYRLMELHEELEK